MTGLWMDLLGRALTYTGLGGLLYVGLRLMADALLGPTTCALACGECVGLSAEDCTTCEGTGEEPDDNAWDRGHDQWTDREAGIW